MAEPSAQSTSDFQIITDVQPAHFGDSENTLSLRHEKIRRDIEDSKIQGKRFADVVTPAVTQRLSTSRLLPDGYQQALALRDSLRRTHQTVATTYNQVRGGHTRELNELNIEVARKIKKPSKIRYYFYIIISGLADTAGATLITAGWAATAFYGAGIILGSAATLFVMFLMWIAGLVFLGKQAKRAKKHKEELQEQSKKLSRDVQLVQQEYRGFLAWAGRVGKEFPQFAARGSALATKTGALARKTGVVKYSGKAVGWITRITKNPWFTRMSEAIPLWNVLPWWTIGAFATYVSHRADWREAQDILSGYNTGKTAVLDMTDSMYQARLAVVGDMFNETTQETNETAQRVSQPQTTSIQPPSVAVVN